MIHYQICMFRCELIVSLFEIGMKLEWICFQLKQRFCFREFWFSDLVWIGINGLDVFGNARVNDTSDLSYRLSSLVKIRTSNSILNARLD